MNLLRKYLRPQRKLVALALLLAALSQVLALVDPIIFGWLVDGYANQRDVKSNEELVRGALRLLGLAVTVAIASRACKAMLASPTSGRMAARHIAQVELSARSRPKAGQRARSCRHLTDP